MDNSKMQLPLLSAYSDQRLGSSCPSHPAALREPGREVLHSRSIHSKCAEPNGRLTDSVPAQRQVTDSDFKFTGRLAIIIGHG